MARANAASTDSRVHATGPSLGFIKPRVSRLHAFEPRLRRAVPALLAIFIMAVATTAFIHLRDLRETTLNEERAALGFLVQTAVWQTDGKLGEGQTLDSLEQSQVGSGRQSKVLLITLPTTVSQSAAKAAVAADLAKSSFADGEHPTIETVENKFLLAHAVAENGKTIIAALPISIALESWWLEVSLITFLLVVTGFLLLIVGFAYHWQARRASEVEDIYEDVRDRLELGLATGRSGLWDWDIEAGRMFWSDSMFSILGLEPVDDLIDIEAVDALIHVEDGSLRDIAASASAANDRFVDRCIRMRSTDDTWVWLRIRGALVVDSRTGNRRVTGIAVDVTAEKLFEQNVRQADTRLRDAIESLSEAFVLWDGEKRLVLSNSRFQELYNLSDNLVVPGTLMSAIDQSGLQRLAGDEGDLSLETVGSRTFEARKADGRWFAINERQTKDGGHVAVATDVTSLKAQQLELQRQKGQLEEGRARLIATVNDLRSSRQDLERRGQQLVELAERYALQTRAAEDASRVKSEFLANMSHELRTPLNHILGFSELMCGEVLGPIGDPRYAAYSAHIHASGTQLLEFFEDILQMATIEAGRRELRREMFGLDRLIAHVLKGARAEIETNRLRLSALLRENTGLEADRGAIRQIILILLSNAIKFTQPGGRVLVRTRQVGSKITLVVADTGIGILKSELPNLGKPFVQLSKQLTKSHGGSGLGLSIATSLASMHGGSLRIRSQVGRGTVVAVTLPACGRSSSSMSIAAE